MKLVHLLSGAASAVVLGAAASAQTTTLPTPPLVENTTKIPSGNPANNSATENVDFGDVDKDGDWDAVFADGGDGGNDQNRIWVNQGGAQGGTVGFFQDRTSTQFPNFSDDSRDIEFVDIDNDGDIDIYVSNTAQLTNQGNRWWVNQGGLQGGNVGFYADDTGNRWVGLGGPGSSLPPAAILSDTFIDWSCDCDFGDLDNDGDIDLVHSTYGGAFNGNVPTRIFLNDGAGHYQEFNPSGFQLTQNNIQNGNPGLWCEGTQQANTTDSTGQFCDIASSPLDIDLGDIDGDYDLDILHGARQELPRMFQNRLEENGGTLSFRDVTGAVFPAGYASGNGHYEQEMGDIDNDGDLDIYGLNWQVQFGLDDVTFRNDGTGHYTQLQVLDGSGGDDNEGDFFDFNNDGKLDLYVAAFGGGQRLYMGDGTGTLLRVTNGITVTTSNHTSLDADCCDVDNDGDYDVFQANDGGAPNQFFENVTQVPDNRAPFVRRVENFGNRVAAPGKFPVRAQVYDNTPYYITWYNSTKLNVSVGGFKLAPKTMQSSMGQIFRGLVDSNLFGAVSYHVTSADKYANTGTSVVQNYSATYGPTFFSHYGTGNPGLAGIPTLTPLSVPFPGEALHLGLQGAPNTIGLLGYAPLPLVPTFHFVGLANVNIDPFSYSYIVVGTGADGKGVFSANLPATLVPGNSIYLQLFTFDGTGGDLLAGSQGLQLTFQ
ncbi:MAG: VCBS repeat-containing protein [Planctomycetota bacterium]